MEIKLDKFIESSLITTNNDVMPNVVINFHMRDQGSAEKLLNLLLAVNEGIDCTYHLQYSDPRETLSIMKTIERFSTEKEVVLHFDLPNISIPSKLIKNDPNLLKYRGIQAKRTKEQKHSILQWNLCVYKFIHLLDSFIVLEPDCVILKEGWLADIHTAYCSSTLPIFGHLKSGIINGSLIPTHWAGCSMYNGRILRELDLERFFYERYENPWWRFRNLPDTTNANNCFYGPAFSGYDISYDYFLFAHYWNKTTGCCDPFQWPVQEIENRNDLIFCDFHSILTTEEIYDSFRDRLPVLHGVKNDNSRIKMTEYFLGGGSSTMTKPKSHSSGTKYSDAIEQHTDSSKLSLQRKLSPEELFVTTNRRLGQFRHKHKGQRCVIIGNGPSLNKMDLSFLENEITFGTNRIFLMFDKWKFRPTYYVSVNPLVIEQSAEEILKIDAPKFLSQNGIPFFDDPGDIHFLRSIPQWFFSKDPRNGLCEGWTVTYVAMQLAYFMGFDEVILIGVDHHFVTQGDPNKEVVSEGDDPNHFHPDYFGKGARWHLPDLERSEGSYRMAKQAFEEENRRIIDATVDGKLTIFPKVDYREIFYKNHTRPNASSVKSRNGQEVGYEYLVSAIASTYNSEKFIRGCLEDLVSQTLFLKGQLEIVVVDSGSLQGEKCIVEDFQQRFPHIKYLRTTERESIYKAWNRAIKASSGKFITNANTDDRHRHDALEILAAEMENNPNLSLVYADQIVTTSENETFNNCSHVGYFDWPDFDRSQLIHCCCIGPQPMWRRSLHEEFGWFDETLKVAGDYDWWLRISETRNIKHVSMLLGLYLLNNNGIEITNQETCNTETINLRRNAAEKSGVRLDYDVYASSFLVSAYAEHAPPLVSVIVPTYNRPEMLAEALQSILNQTFRDFEIIVINDAGVNVDPLIKHFSSHGTFRYINKETNQGIAAARNSGIRIARGKYIAYLDDDDIYYPDHLQTLVDFLEGSLFQVAYTDSYRAVQEKTGNTQTTVRRDTLYGNDFDADQLLVKNYIPLLCVMYERKCMELVGLFDESLVHHEDWDLWIRLSQHYPFGHIQKKTAEFTRRNTDASSLTTGTLPSMLVTLERVYEKSAMLAESKPKVVSQRKAYLFDLKNRIHGFLQNAAESLLAPLECGKLPHVDNVLEQLHKTGASSNQILAAYYHSLGLRRSQDDPVSALAFFSRALSADPVCCPVHRSIVETLLQIGKIDKAVRHCEVILSQEPNDPELIDLMAAIARQLGNQGKAESWDEAAKKLRMEMSAA